MTPIEVYGALKTYIKNTLVGMGALKGAPCQIQSIVEDPTGTNTITFEWQDSEGTTHTDTLVLHDGVNSYTYLDDKPRINGFELDGSVSWADLQAGSTILVDTANSVIENDPNVPTGKAVYNALLLKVGEVSVNGVAQTVSAGAVDLDIDSNLMTETMWAQIEAVI